MENAIFFSVNQRFFEHLSLCFKSIIKYYPNHPDIIVNHVDLTKNQITYLKNILPSKFIQSQLDDNELWPIMGHLDENINPKVFYARFMIWKSPIFNNYDKILFLDSDILIIKPLDHLFTQDSFFITEEYYKGEDAIFKLPKSEELKSKLAKDGIVETESTANAWIFLVPKSYRSKEFYNQIVYILEKYKKYIKRADQSIINIRMMINKLAPDNTYLFNFQHRLVLNKKFDKILDCASIVHFNGVPDKIRLKLMYIGYYLLPYKLWKYAYRLFYYMLNNVYL